MRLADWQHGLLAAVLDGDSALAAGLADQPGRSAERGLQIQRASVQGIQIWALAETFPVVRRLLGEDSFDALAQRYLRGHPSRHWSLAELGRNLAMFLENFEPLANWPYLADVASLEWAWHRVFHAPAEVAPDWQVLEKMSVASQADTRLRLPRSVRLLHSEFPVLAIWQANQADVADATVSLDGRPGDRLVVSRDADAMPRIDGLSEPEWDALTAISQGITLGELIRNPEHAELVPRLVRSGWIDLEPPVRP